MQFKLCGKKRVKMSSLSTRREFIEQSLSATVLALSMPQLSNSKSLAPKILVVLELTGGNDGLNTFVPFGDEAYWRARPNLAVPRQKLLPINHELALHPALRKLATLYEQGQVAIINGVGYDASSRSHFQAMNAWHSARPEATEDRSGWIGRYLEAADLQENSLGGVVIGNQLPLAFASQNQNNAVSLLAPGYDDRGLEPAQRTLHALYQNHIFTAPMEFASHAFTGQKYDDKLGAAARYPQTQLARSLKTVARLIASQSVTRVFYVSLDGFDTHENQSKTHAQLLFTLSDALAAFQRDLKGQGREKDVLTLTISEFGRSVHENAMHGTDHGAASCLFAIGASVRGGIYGSHPDLNDLEEGALRPTTDFRRVYATVLEKCLRADSKRIVNGRFAPLNFI